MTVKQFEDPGLAHYSYILMSEGEIAIIDPARNPQPYYEYAMLHDARIVAVVETHPHADFVSSHLEIGQVKEAEVYASGRTQADYPHNPFDDGDFFQIGQVTLHALNTPGHSPDSICVLVKDAAGTPQVLFSGDTLFVGDVGRPDLRESAGPVTATREALARDLYHSVREKLIPLPDAVQVYPAHGAGSLCGKGIGRASSSTMGAEKAQNPALQIPTETAFVDYLLADQPFVPLYFPFAVDLNKKGAPTLRESLLRVPLLPADSPLQSASLVVDTRPAPDFRRGHLPQALNIQDGLKFETWLGSVIAPEETFYLVAASEEALNGVIAKAAKIGYERHIRGGLVTPRGETETSPVLNLADFRQHPGQFTIIDIRNPGEVKEKVIFRDSLAIPLPELRQRLNEVPLDKPIVVHCAGGYRSAAGSSILANAIKSQVVYDLGEAVQTFG